MTIRPATEADHAQVARICLVTGADGGDATGRFADDAVLAEIYALPYLYGPDCFALVWDVAGEARGYVVGAADTARFQEWFSEEWWPSRPRREARTADDGWLLPGADNPRRTLIPQLVDFPAHLHIDLLPDQQGRGAGRQLIEAACALLAERGVPGVHLVPSSENKGALAFYPRVGFELIAVGDTTVTFGRRLTASGS